MTGSLRDSQKPIFIRAKCQFYSGDMRLGPEENARGEGHRAPWPASATGCYPVIAHDEFMLIKSQRTPVLHGSSKRGALLCNILLQRFPETLCSTEHCIRTIGLHHILLGEVSKRSLCLESAYCTAVYHPASRDGEEAKLRGVGGSDCIKE